MNILEFFAEPMWQRLAEALLHFIWQGLAIAGLLGLVLKVAPPREASVRYALSLAALISMLLAPLVTLAVLPATSQTSSGRDGGPVPIVTAFPARGSSEPGPALSHLAGSAATPLHPSRALEPTASAPARTHERASPPFRASVSTSLASWVVVGWLGGVGFLGLRLLGGATHGRRLCRRGRKPPRTISQQVEAVAVKLGLRRVPRVLEVSGIHEAAVMGLFKPVVLLPFSWTTGMSPSTLEAVLAHELAHLYRCDLWALLLQRATETLLCYHPAVWFVSRQLQEEREICCDRLAVGVTGRREVYATALELALRSRLEAAVQPLGVNMGGRKMIILERVRNVLGVGPVRRPSSWWPIAGLVLAIPLTIALVSESPLVSTAGARSATGGGGTPSSSPPAAPVAPLTAATAGVVETLQEEGAGERDEARAEAPRERERERGDDEEGQREGRARRDAGASEEGRALRRGERRDREAEEDERGEEDRRRRETKREEPPLERLALEEARRHEALLGRLRRLRAGIVASGGGEALLKQVDELIELENLRHEERQAEIRSLRPRDREQAPDARREREGEDRARGSREGDESAEGTARRRGRSFPATFRAVTAGGKGIVVEVRGDGERRLARTLRLPENARVVADGKPSSILKLGSGSSLRIWFADDARRTIREIEAEGPTIGGRRGVEIRRIDPRARTITVTRNTEGEATYRTLPVAPEARIAIGERRCELSELSERMAVRLKISVDMKTVVGISSVRRPEREGGDRDRAEGEREDVPPRPQGEREKREERGAREGRPRRPPPPEDDE